jgi:hypothetical protein
MGIILVYTSSMLRQKAEEVALKINIEFIPLNGWLVQFRKRAELSYRTMSGECKSVIEEEVGI